MQEFIDSHRALLLSVLPLVAGVCLGIAEKKRWQAQVHDSVLRYSYRADDWRAESMRSAFCAIVNGTKPLLHVDNTELPEWKNNVLRFLLFATVTLFLVIVLVTLNSDSSEGANVQLKQWALVSPAASAFFLVYYSIRLSGKTHRTRIHIRPEKKGGRWTNITITAERDEDGMPTRNVKVDP